jgi:hypothetical protein
VSFLSLKIEKFLLIRDMEGREKQISLEYPNMVCPKGI